MSRYEIFVKAKAKPEDKKDRNKNQRQPGGRDGSYNPTGWDHRSGREDTFRPWEQPVHIPGPSGLY